MRDVTMEASGRLRSIWWWFWTCFVANTCNITLFSQLRSRDVPAPDNKSRGCCCRNSLPTVINPLSMPRGPYNNTLLWTLVNKKIQHRFSGMVKYIFNWKVLDRWLIGSMAHQHFVQGRIYLSSVCVLMLMVVVCIWGPSQYPKRRLFVRSR